MIKINFANECYAMDIWNNISSKQKTKILENVWCSKCREKTTMKNFRAMLKSSLLLYGICCKCKGIVCRNIEIEEKGERFS